MGGFGSKAAKKVFSPFCGDQNIPTSSELSKFQGVKLASPFVLTRKGSMFFDEDGELAHEFYEEVFSKKRKRNYLKRINTNLTPQGDVKYEVPRIHPDFHIILCPSR